MTDNKEEISNTKEEEGTEKEEKPLLLGYCFGCKKNQPFKHPTYVESNKRTRVSGNCSECNRGLSTFISSKHSEEKKRDGAGVVEPDASSEKHEQ